MTDGSSVYGVGNGFLYAADARTGKARWSWRDGGLIPQFVVGRTLICVDTTGRAMGFDTVMRRPVWQRMLYDVRPGATLASAAVSPEANLFYLGDSNGVLQAFDVATGTTRWGLVGGGFGGTLLPAGGLLYVAGRPNAGLTALDARTGTTRWTSQLRAYSLVISGGRLFVGGDGLAALDPMTGVTQWARSGEAGGMNLDNGIATAAGGVLVYVRSQQLEGVNPAAGQVVWSLAIPSLTGLNNFAVSNGNRLFVGNEAAVLGFQFPA